MEALSEESYCGTQRMTQRLKKNGNEDRPEVSIC